MSRILPDFSQIVFVTHEIGVQPTQPAESANLFRLFRAVLDHEALEIHEGQLRTMISQDLDITVNTLDERLMAVLTEALVYYMNIWPGWQRAAEYYKGEISCPEWYQRFQSYLTLKCNFIIRNADKYAAEVYNETARKDVALQAEVNRADKKIAPYTLCISGPPLLLDNLVFEESEGDILIKQQKANPWCSLKLNEFLNWPYVAVGVKLKDIAFTRTNAHKYERFVTFSDNLTIHPEANHVKYVKKKTGISETEMVPYSCEFIAFYLHQYYEALKGIPGISRDRLQELKAVFVEYLHDIREANVYNYTMCTNTCVGLNIGKCKYVRRNVVQNKTVDQTLIDYYEILTPQVDFALNSFSAIQEPNINGKISFQSTSSLPNCTPSSLQTMVYHINNNCIVYRCTLCEILFTGSLAYQDLGQHFYEKHKALQPIECFRCHNKFDIKLLAGQRWAHKCTVDP